LIGRNEYRPDDKQVLAISSFTGNCGTAFQLKDDILGIEGNQDEIGKPVGSDIREGKKTVILHEALKNASEKERAIIRDTLGNKQASSDQVDAVAKLFRVLGGIARAERRASELVDKALNELPKIPHNRYRDLLESWAYHMVHRNR
jgi:geranylgeranyl diphosphate synthase type I